MLDSKELNKTKNRALYGFIVPSQKVRIVFVADDRQRLA
jgi:hypothetical protein